MFFYKTDLVRRIRIHPQYIRDKYDPHKTVRKMLKQDLRDNPFTTQHGYVVRLIYVESIGDGYCLPLLGFIEYAVKFEAMLYYPIVGEVVDAVVEMVTGTCIVFKHICVYGVVRSYCLNDQDFFKYEERCLVPKGEEKQSGALIKEGLFRSETNEEKVIEKGTVIRVRITRRTLGGKGFFLVGTMSSEFLGPLKSPPGLLNMPAAPSSMDLPQIKEEIMEKFEVGEDIIPRDELQEMWDRTDRRHFALGHVKAEVSNEDVVSSIASIKLEPNDK